MNKWFISLTVALVLCGQGAYAAQFNAPEAEAEGEIQVLDFGNNTMVVGGYIYEVSPTADVEINGSYGPSTMLEEGMLIEFSFLRYDDGVRRIISMVEVDEVEEY